MTVILEHYGIAFRIVNFGNRKFGTVDQVNSAIFLSYPVSIYLSQNTYTDIWENDILVEIENAINELSFESDAGGETVFLEIGMPNSTFSYSGVSAAKPIETETISTTDLKEIISLWANFLKENKLENR